MQFPNCLHQGLNSHQSQRIDSDVSHSMLFSISSIRSMMFIFSFSNCSSVLREIISSL